MPVSISGAGSISGLDQGFNVTSGSVGIGTDNPALTAHIFSTAATDVALIESTQNFATLRFKSALNSSGPTIGIDGAGGLQLDQKDTSKYISFAIGSERLRITSGGDVLIADTTNSIYDDSTGGGMNLKANGQLVLKKQATSTADPLMWLNDTGQTTNKFILFAQDGNEKASIGLDGNDLRFARDGYNETLRITSGGKTGVGVASPQQKLDVVGYAHTVAVFRPDTNTTSSYGDASVVNNLVNLRMPYGSNPGSANNNGARWGIKFQGRNDGAEYGTDTSKSASIYAVSEDTTAGYNRKVGLAFYTSGLDTNQSEKLRITSDGRVCINATSPVQVGGQTPYLYVSSYTNLDGLRIRGLDTGNTIWKTGGDMSLTVGSNDAINLKTNGTTRFVLNANSNNSTTLSIGNGNNLTNNTSPDRTSVKVGGTLHLEASFAGSNHKTGMYYNCSASGQSNFYQGTFAASGGDYRAAAATMNHGAFKVYTDPSTSTNYSAGAQITTMKETLTCANGFVLAPNQPCFWATSNTGGSDTSNGYQGIISNQFEAAYVNVGNHYNTSTGVFTCPVAGTYEFHGQGLIRHQSGVGRAELSFYKNGANTMSRSYGYTYITGASDHDNLHVMGYITCAANDQIDFRVYACDSGIDVYWGQGLGYFAGRLVQ